ncbi:MAG TPA: relaxase domain-containing protein [Urbifossiella sp.]|jgi:hypothetical protein|nr:relaxase domain-containing protein [Urbifossiella sp.]
MIRFRDIRDANAAGSYYGKSDGGYYLDASDLRRGVGGKGAHRLGLESTPDFDQFKRLLQGLDPHSGDQLTAKLVEHRLAGWDITATIPKGVTIAIERGVTRVHQARWEAVRLGAKTSGPRRTRRPSCSSRSGDSRSSSTGWGKNLPPSADARRGFRRGRRRPGGRRRV